VTSSAGRAASRSSRASGVFASARCSAAATTAALGASNAATTTRRAATSVASVSVIRRGGGFGARSVQPTVPSPAGGGASGKTDATWPSGPTPRST
jgi:hypothetical protein